MLDKIRQTFYWPDMTADVERYCSQCHSCGARKPSKPKRSPLGFQPVVAPLERVALDILGPLPRSEQGNKYVLVICDLFTHWTEAIAIPDQLSETVVKAFVNEYVSRFGVPLQIHTDRGTNSVSKVFSKMCKLLQIHQTFSTPLHPQSNASVERFNRILGAMLSMYCKNNQRQWDQYLPQVMMAYRSSVHSTTGQTPNMMVFGRDIVLPVQAFVGLPPQDCSDTDAKPSDDFVLDLRDQLEEIHTLARHSLNLKQVYRKRHYDSTAKSRQFKPGDAVWVHDTTRKPGVCSKLSPSWLICQRKALKSAQ